MRERSDRRAGVARKPGPAERTSGRSVGEVYPLDD
jgi:hypothetical protein